MPRTIAHVIFEGAEELDFVGPWEVFTMLAMLVPDSCTNVMVSEKGGDVTCAKGMVVRTQHSFESCPAADIFVVPGGFATRKEKDNPAILDFVRKLAATAEVSASVCTGSFILERAGLLQGKRATTHWAAYDEFRALGGDTELVTSGRWVDEGHVVTAAGVSAGIDMSLHLVGRLWSPEVARNVQKAMEYFPDPPYAD